MSFKRIRRAAAAFVTAGIAVAGLTACSSEATTADMCAYTQGTGRDGADADVHKIYYPGQQFTPGLKEEAWFFPCSARNLRFVPGSTDVYADHTPERPHYISSIRTRTSTGNEVLVDVTFYWTINQTEAVLREATIPLLNKYQAASTNADVRNANFSTDGWSLGFLAENFTPIAEATIDRIVRSMDDSVWLDPAMQDEVAKRASELFMTSFRAATGSASDVVCGSGESSGWTDPEKPGEGTFECGNVRVSVTKIDPVDQTLVDLQARLAKADQERAVNASELEAARAKYGEEAERVLGDLDIIQACAEAGLEVCSTAGGLVVGTGQ